MSELELLTTMLKSQIRNHVITTDGNCFFHALEYALGNCLIDDRKNPLFNQTRIQVSELLLGKYEHELKELQKQIQKNRNPRLLRERIGLQRMIAFIHHFMNSLEYSTEEVIYFSAMLKEKIFLIVRDQPFDGEFQTTLIIPEGVSITRDNVLVLIHSNGNHYNTLTYPLTLSDKFLNMLRRYNASDVDQRSTDVGGIQIKFGVLKHVLHYYKGLEEIRKETQILTNHAMAERLARYENNLDELQESNLMYEKEWLNQFNQETLNLIATNQLKQIENRNAKTRTKTKIRTKTKNRNTVHSIPKAKSSTKKRFWNPFKMRRSSRRNSKPTYVRGQSLNRPPK
jgi:hypothetical protein